MDGILRVKTGLVIEVNDNGDTITACVEDVRFIDRFYNLLGKFTEASDELKEVDNLTEREQRRVVIEKTQEIISEIDGLFGEGCCKKVFGDIVPSPFLLMEFFDQLIPVFNKYSDDRQKKIESRYNKGRKGSKSNKYRTKEEIIRDAMR